MNVVTRFPPSPTGYLHIGSARTALYNWLFARRYGGHFVLRLEDTDRERSTQQAVDVILKGMAWLGLDYDEGPYYQTQRFDRYAAVTAKLVEEGKAYRCYCSRERLKVLREAQMVAKEKPRYDGHCRDNPDAAASGNPPVVRFIVVSITRPFCTIIRLSWTDGFILVIVWFLNPGTVKRSC